MLRTAKNAVTGVLCCKLCCCVKFYKIKLLIWVTKCCLCKGPTYMGLCLFPQAKKTKIIYLGVGMGERVNIINAPASAKLRKIEVDLLGFCPGLPTL